MENKDKPSAPIQVGGWSDEDMCKFAEFADVQDRGSWIICATNEHWLSEYKLTHSPIPVCVWRDEQVAQIIDDYRCRTKEEWEMDGKEFIQEYKKNIIPYNE